MQGKISRTKETGFSIGFLIKCLLVSYIITAMMLMILAFLLYKVQLPEKVVLGGTILTYVLSTFCGGFLAGKKMGVKKFMWGLLLGAVYFSILLVVSVIGNQSMGEITDSFLTTMILCVGGGMLGGMLS